MVVMKGVGEWICYSFSLALDFLLIGSSFLCKYLSCSLCDIVWLTLEELDDLC